MYGYALNHVVISDSSSHVAESSIILKILDSVVKCCITEMKLYNNFTFGESVFVQSLNVGPLNFAGRCFSANFATILGAKYKTNVF